MAYTTINKHTDYFNTLIWTGNGNATRSYTGVGFQPDLLWTKNRSASQNYMFTDAVRGLNNIVQSSTDSATITNPSSGYLSSFDSDGFSVQAGSSSTANFNTNSQNYVAWNWKANGQGSSNTNGTINTTYTSVNTTAGFSIIKYTGNGTTNATIGHGLGVEPAMIFFKRTDTSNNWIVYQKTMGTGHYLTLNTTGAKDSASGAWCTPSSTLIQLNQVFGATNTNGATYIAYCFAEKTGYSKIGSYTGNGNADGSFIYCGFKPSFILRKCTASSTAENWVINDNKRDVDNVSQLALFPNNANVEDTATHNAIDICSNGFKVRTSDGRTNGNNNNYIYMAFGQSIVGSNNIPCTAR